MFVSYFLMILSLEMTGNTAQISPFLSQQVYTL